MSSPWDIFRTLVIRHGTVTVTTTVGGRTSSKTMEGKEAEEAAREVESIIDDTSKHIDDIFRRIRRLSGDTE